MYCIHFVPGPVRNNLFLYLITYSNVFPGPEWAVPGNGSDWWSEMDKSHQQWRMGHAHSECIYRRVCELLQYYILCGLRSAPLFQVSLKSGTNILYWRTTGILVGGKMVKPVLLKNIQIEGKCETRAHTCVLSGCVCVCACYRVSTRLSRCRLHIRVFSVPTRLVQPDPRLLVLPAVPQQHLLCEGGVLVYTLPWAPLLTYVHLCQQHFNKLWSHNCQKQSKFTSFYTKINLYPISTRLKIWHICVCLLPQMRDGLNVRWGHRAQRRTTSRSTQPATARGRSAASARFIFHVHTTHNDLSTHTRTGTHLQTHPLVQIMVRVQMQSTFRTEGQM